METSRAIITARQSLRIEEADLSTFETLSALNEEIFEEQRIINTFDREDLTLLYAFLEDIPVGFKLGYRESRHVFYSAKGGVLESCRRMGIARLMLAAMVERVRAKGYARFAFDTFPNRHPGMAVMGLQEGFRITKADYNMLYKDFRIRFEKRL